MMKRGFLALGVMLASSASWYLPALFLSCLLWAFSVQLHESLRQRAILQRLFMWAPPVLTAGLLLSRAVDVLTLDPNHPEVALVLGQGADFGLRFKVLMTGQGAVEGALCSLFVFSIFSPRLPSLRGSSRETASFVQSRMMAHAGWWSLVVLMLLFEPSSYRPVDHPPDAPTLSPGAWTDVGLVAMFTLLLMMAGEILSSTAHMASSGETHLLLRRALLKTAIAAVVAWTVLFQSDVFTSTWWARPTADAHLAFALLVAVHATLMMTVHAFSTSAEGLQASAGRQAKTLAWVLSITALTLLVLTSSLTRSVQFYPEGLDAVLIGWRWTSFALLLGAASMVLPTAGFDAAHHPESWWFRVCVAMVLPFSVLLSDGGWLLIPALLLAGAGQQLVLMKAVLTDETRNRFTIGGLVWALCIAAAVVANEPLRTLALGLVGLGVVSALAWDVLRIERGRRNPESAF